MVHSDIMIVDDNPANLRLLEDMLVQGGHEVRSFPLGRLALAAAMRNPPQLFLLDINMPEMNGYEVCEQLKITPSLSDIPVIFLSALNETEDKLKGFKSGAVDYIPKPFQFEEVHARVETHLRLHELQRALKSQNERLEEAVAARTRELANANERLTLLDRSKSDFLNLISHEFRTPLNGLLGVSELILEEMPSADENQELREIYDHSRRRILSLLDDAVLLTEIDVSGHQFKDSRVSLDAALGLAIERTAGFAETRGVAIAPAWGNLELEVVRGDKALLVRAFHALLEAAVKFSDAGETVRLTEKRDAGCVKISMDTHGKVIPSSVLSKFFDLFAVEEASTSGGDLGLGPAVASRILSLFRGEVSVENRTVSAGSGKSGIRLTISLRDATLGDG